MKPSEAIALGLCPSCMGTGRVDRCVPYQDIYPCSSCGGGGTWEDLEREQERIAKLFNE
jgi:hypothetical protein